MKKIERLSEPESFFKGEKKIEFYLDLYDKNGKIRDRWNLLLYKDDVRKRLLEMSKNECAYCGKEITVSDMDIEHFFPKEKFPYLSYCFENYLPSCKRCNQNVKRSFYPKSLEDKKDKLSEEILIGQIENLIKYERAAILSETVDRIIEPSFDDIEEHLEFIPEASVYTAKTEIGKRTKELFFEHREVTKKMEKISNLVFQILSNQKEEIHNEFQSLIRVTGYSFYIDKYLEFWKEILSIKEFDGTEHL